MSAPTANISTHGGLDDLGPTRAVREKPPAVLVTVLRVSALVPCFVQIPRKSNTLLYVSGYQLLKYQVGFFKYPMTERTQLVFDFIKAYMKIHGIPPSYEVIAKGLGLKSKSNIHRIVHKLKDEGLIETKPYKFHAIRLVDKSAREMAAL